MKYQTSIFSKHRKKIAVFLAFVFLSEIITPTAAWALTGGPSQPEVASFEPISTNQMVDLFSGDFTYNIPLLDLEGYPINIAYHGGVGMEGEASWVGWGWNINPGVINRSVRGIPDDFNGQEIKKEIHIRKEKTLSISTGAELEIAGLKTKKRKGTAKVGLQFFFNNYKGYYVAPELGFNLALNSTSDGATKMGMNVGLNHNAQSGLSIYASPTLNFSGDHKTDASLGVGGLTYNSRTQSINLSLAGSLSLKSHDKDNIKSSVRKDKKNGKIGTRTAVQYQPDRNMTGSVGTAPMSSIPIGRNTYVPASTPQFSNTFGNVRFTAGVEAWTNHPSFYGEGSYSEKTSIGYEPDQLKAYGYLYLQNRKKSSSGKRQDENFYRGMADFNRDGNNGVFNPNQNYLAPSNLTYDVLSVNAQGTGGTYRPFRNDVGVVSDPGFYSPGFGGAALGIEVGVGGTARFGGDGSVKYTIDKGGQWVQPALESYKFIGNKVGDLYENVYYKVAGEIVPVNETYDAHYGELSLQFDLPKRNKLGNVSPSGKLLHHVPYTSNNKKISPRQARGRLVSTLTAKEASSVGLNNKIYSYPADYPISGTPTAIEYVDAGADDPRKENHIAQITQIEKDGSRYVFGLPAYNNTKEEVLFNASKGLKGSPAQKTISGDKIEYDPDPTNGDASLLNDRGRDNFYSKTTTPGYAHSYLITGYLSPDYIDVTGDGITPDDLGNGVRFNWKRVEENMGWRTPLPNKLDEQANKIQASYYPGNDADPFDDKGSYTYGEKELWYLQSIESRNYVAIFRTSSTSRTDAQGVDHKGHKVSSQKSHQLDRIDLYAREDINKPGTPTPIKSIKFTYLSGGLCAGAANATNGKLALQKIEFYHGHNGQSAFKPYVFDYYTQVAGSTVSYNDQKVDKWGNYKGSNPGSPELTKSEYPYVNQNVSQATADEWAKLWNLKSIQLPSGGTITVDYESDDYGYVQDRRATEMIRAVGMGNGPTYNPGWTQTDLYWDQGSAGKHNDHVYFEFPENIKQLIYNDPTNTTAIDAEIAKLFTGIDDLYYKFKVDVGWDHGYNFVSGYADFNAYGRAELPNNAGPSPTHGYIRLKKTKVGFAGVREVNPIVANALQFFTTSMPDKVGPGGTSANNSYLDMAKKFIGIIPDLIQTVVGPVKYLMMNGVAKKFDNNVSLIRLNKADGKKRGGGNRVKSVVLSDNWGATNSSSDGEAPSTYGQNYTYQNEDGSSSGVATFEPMIGAEENPLRRPSRYMETKNPGLSPNWELFQELPLGETFYPPPSVGYGRVVVQSIHADKPSGQNYQVSEFYTAKDFPVIAKATRINVKEPPKGAGLIKSPVGYSKTKNHFGATQGYTFILNDMHGKPMFEGNYGVYGEKEVLLSGKRYNYQEDKIYGKRILNNKVPAVLRDGTIGEIEIGKESDVTIDSKFFFHSDKTDNVKGSLDVFQIGPMPWPLPMILPLHEENEMQIGTAVITKIIQNYGIMSSIEEFDMNRKVVSENLVYDGHTGDVLVSSVKNEFGDPLMTSALPAYWVRDYDKMGHAYRNIGFEDLGGDQIMILDECSNQDAIEYMKHFIYEGLMDSFLGNLLSYKNKQNADYPSASPQYDGRKLNEIYGYLMTKDAFVPGDEVLIDGTTPRKAWVINVLDASQIKTLRDEVACSTATITVPSGTNLGTSCEGVLSKTQFETQLSTKLGIDANDIGAFVDVIVDYSNNKTSSSSRACNLLQFFPTQARHFQSFNNTPAMGELGRLFNVGNQSSKNYTLNNTGRLIKEILADRDLFNVMSHWVNSTPGSNLTLEEKVEVFEEIMTDPDLLLYMTCNMQYPGILKLMSKIGCDQNTFDFVRYTIKYENELFTKDDVYDPFNGSGSTGSGGSTGGGTGGGENPPGGGGGPAPIDMEYPMLYLGANPELGSPIANPEPAPAPAPAPAPTPSYTTNSLGYFFFQNSFPTDYWMYELASANVQQQLLFSRCNEPHLNVDCNRKILGSSAASNQGPTADKNEFLPCCLFEGQNFDMTGKDLVIFITRDGSMEDQVSDNLVKVVRSGRRNLLTASVGEVATFGETPFVYHDDLSTPTYAELTAYITGDKVLNAGAKEFSEVWTTDRKLEHNVVSINPYVYGIRGNFREHSTYFVNDWRKSSAKDGNSRPDLRNDGVFDNFKPYWDFGEYVNSLKRSTYVEEDWHKASENTLYSAINSNSLEMSNPIDANDEDRIYTTEIIGPFNKASALANNAEHKEILFEDFEEHNRSDFIVNHDKLYKDFVTTDYRTNKISHTGLSSLHVWGSYDPANRGSYTPPGFTGPENYPPQTIGRNATYSSPIPIGNYSSSKKSLNIELDIDPYAYGMEKYLINEFQPNDEGWYIISGWIKDGFNNDYTYTDPVSGIKNQYTYKTTASITVTTQNSGGITSTTNCLVNIDDAPYVDGWQRFTAQFQVNRTTTGNKIKIDIDGGAFGLYLDDLRIYPKDGSMKSYVYDPYVMRLSAELDENNFATFYDYDFEGNLIRIRKETARGIMTIQESKKYSIK